MIANGIEVSIQNVSSKKSFEEIRSPASPNQYNTRYIEVTPGQHFAINVTIHTNFPFGRFKNAYLRCRIYGSNVELGYMTDLKLVKPVGFQNGEQSIAWSDSNGLFLLPMFHAKAYFDFAFGRDLNSKLGTLYTPQHSVNRSQS